MEHMIKMDADFVDKEILMIPLLKQTSINYKNLFSVKKDLQTIEESFYDIVVDNYPNVVLDMYSSCLNEDSKELADLDNEYFRLSSEYKYINFIIDVFNHNSNTCIINISSDFKKYDNIISYMSQLDKIDQYLLLKQFKDNNYTNDMTYTIQDSSLLIMFMKGILREIFNVTLYFPDKPLLLFSNFDMSLPLVFKSENDKIFYQKLAEENELFFR